MDTAEHVAKAIALAMEPDGVRQVISALQMAMLGGLRYHEVRDAVLAHPTMGEGLNLLFDTLTDGDRLPTSS